MSRKQDQEENETGPKVKIGKPDPSPMSNPPGRDLERELYFKLERDEIHDMGLEAAKLDGEIDVLELEQKESNASYNERIEERDTTRREISAVLRAKQELRRVKVREVRNFAGNTVEYWYAGRKMDERAMEQGERQEEIDFNSKPRTGPDAESGSVRKGRQPKKEKDADEKPANVHSLRPGTTDPEVSAAIVAETNRSTKRNALDGIHE